MRKNSLKILGTLLIFVMAATSLGCGGKSVDKSAANDAANKNEKKVVRVAFTNY